MRPPAPILQFPRGALRAILNFPRNSIHFVHRYEGVANAANFHVLSVWLPMAIAISIGILTKAKVLNVKWIHFTVACYGKMQLRKRL